MRPANQTGTVGDRYCRTFDEPGRKRGDRGKLLFGAYGLQDREIRVKPAGAGLCLFERRTEGLNLVRSALRVNGLLIAIEWRQSTSQEGSHGTFISGVRPRNRRGVALCRDGPRLRRTVSS